MIVVHTDASWVGDRRSRKSTSGGLIQVGSSTVTHWARGQPVIAMSSGEAEFYSMVSLVAELIALQSLCKDWNLAFALSMQSDASAAMAMAQRRGLGRAKHIQTCYLWIQEKISDMKIGVHKVDTANQLADLLTKFLSRERMTMLLARMNFVLRNESHELTLAA